MRDMRGRCTAYYNIRIIKMSFVQSATLGTAQVSDLASEMKGGKKKTTVGDGATHQMY